MASDMNPPHLTFLDKDTLVLDNSRLETTSCPRKGYYTICHRRVSADSNALIFGGHIHLGLKLRYVVAGSSQPSPRLQAQMQRLTEKLWELQPTSIGDHRTSGLAMDVLAKYNVHYLQEPFDLIKKPNGEYVVEEAFALPLGEVNVDNQWYKILWSGRLDLPIVDGGEVWIMDHKTTSISLTEYYFTDFVMNSALKGYCWSLQNILGVQVRGAVINALGARTPPKTGRGKDPVQFARQKFYFSPVMLEEWKHETLHLIERFLRDYFTGVFPRFTTQCIGKYGRCPYFDVCNLEPALRETYLQSGAFRDDTWSPLQGDLVDLSKFLTEPFDEAQYQPKKYVGQQPVVDLVSDILEEL